MATIVYPDAYGVWEEDGSRVEFMLEYDRGTKNLDRLAAKLEGYEGLERVTKVRRWVLFGLRTERREAGVRRCIGRITATYSDDGTCGRTRASRSGLAAFGDYAIPAPTHYVGIDRATIR